MNSAAVAAFLINALVQIPVIALVAMVAARALRRAPARQQHLVWAAALAACVASPLASMAPRKVEPPVVSQATGGVPGASSSGASTFSLEALLERTRRPAAGGVNPAGVLAAGYAVFILYRTVALTLAWRRTRRILRSARVDVTDQVLARCGAALGRIGVPVISSPAVATPMTLGALHPVIVIPRALLDELSGDALVAVVGHELAHIRRHDFFLNVLLEVAALPIAFHPLTAFLKRRIAETRELACDEQVTPDLVAPRDYARALVEVAAFACAASTPTYSLTMAGGDFEARIRRITGRTTVKHSRTLLATAWAVLAISSAAAAAMAVHPAPNDEPAAAQTPRFEERIDVSATRFSSPDAEARAAAACNAGRARDASAIPTLLAMLSDDAPIRPMRCYGGTWTPALTWFDRPSPGEQAALALASISAPAVDSLLAALNDRSPAARRNAAWAIGEARGGSGVNRDAALTPLIRLLTDGDATVRRAAAFGLSELKSRDAVEPLLVALGDNDAAVRGTVVLALGEIRDRRATLPLAQAVLDDADPEVRRAAAWALGEIRDARAVDALTAALADPVVRAAAERALAEIDD